MYRLYNPNSGEHFYTAVDKEKDYLKSIGWVPEGVSWKDENISFYALKEGYEFHYVHGDVPYFSQIDPRWKDQRFGGLTMGV